MAAVHPDPVAVVATPALEHVVGVVRLRHFIVGIDDDLPGRKLVRHAVVFTTSRRLQVAPHLEDVVSGLEVGDVDPLAVDVVSVRVPAAHRDALVAKVGALVAFLDAFKGERG